MQHFSNIRIMCVTTLSLIFMSTFSFIDLISFKKCKMINKCITDIGTDQMYPYKKDGKFICNISLSKCIFSKTFYFGMCAIPRSYATHTRLTPQLIRSNSLSNHSLTSTKVYIKQIMPEALPRALLLLTTYECSSITYFYSF